MSRSYRHTPIVKDGGISSKKNKQRANRYVRRCLNRNLDLELQGCSYKKVYNTWEINDYVSRYTVKQAIQEYSERCSRISYLDTWFIEKYPTLNDYLNEYYKWYFYK